MYNEYKVQLMNSSQIFDGENFHKVIHSVLTHLFEQCLCRPWKKGDEIPNFKIIRSVYKKMFILTNEEIKEKSFTYQHKSEYGNIENNTVSVTKIASHVGVVFEKGDEVEINGLLCMSGKPPGSKSKEAFVRLKYKNTKFIRDPEVFLGKIRKETGVVVEYKNIVVNPIFISPDLIPNQKQVCDAFEIRCTGFVDDPSIVSEKQFSSVGRNITYGFGSLAFDKIEKEEIIFDSALEEE